MAAPSCISPSACKELAKKVVSKLTDSQKSKYGITNAEQESDAIKTLTDVIRVHIGKENNISKRNQMLQNVDGFIDFLDNFLTTIEVSDSEFDSVKEQYDKFMELVEENGWSRLTNFDFNQDDTESENKFPQSVAEDLLAVLSLYSDVISTNVLYYDEKKTKVKSVSFILMEPQKNEKDSPQEKTIKKLEDIRNMSQMEVFNPNKRGETKLVYSFDDMPKGWRPTGWYVYNGQRIRAIGVTKDVDPSEYLGPALAAPIGTSVDKVGRFYFDKESALWDDGKLVNDDELEDIIASEFGGIFTVAGVKNLISDFEKLENKLKNEWGDDIKVISKEVRMLGKKEDGSWVVGYPDLLVVDRKGTVHTLDFKTSKISTLDGYVNIFHDEKEKRNHTGEKYGKQVTRYIKMEESYGLSVDPNPYVVLIDTWYDASDTIEKRKTGKTEKEKRGAYQTNLSEGTIGFYNDDGTVTSLGEYAEQNPIDREELLFGDDEKEILYMEPRLHLDIKKEGDHYTYSEELAALRGSKDIPFDPEITFEKQWDLMSEDEKQGMLWLGAHPIKRRTAQGIVLLSSSDIESNPDLIGSQEISDVAEYMMYLVSKNITRLQKGQSVPGIALSYPDGDKQSTAFAGKSRGKIIKQVGNGSSEAGIRTLIDIAFETIKKRYHEDFPSEEEYKNEDYDDLEYDFEDEKDYKQQKLMNDKAKWLIDHKEQFITAGTAKLMALENTIVPKRNLDEQSEEFNSTAPNVGMPIENLEVKEDTGDNESNETFADMYIEGLTNVEAWMLGQRNLSPKSSLAQEIKRLFEDIDMVDENGNVIKDPYGWDFSLNIDATKAIQTVLEACRFCETEEEQIDALKELALNPQNLWVNQIIDRISADKNLRKKFFRHFRKDNLTYSICQVKFDKKTGARTVETRIVNMKSAYDVMTQSLGADFNSGKVGMLTVEGVNMALVSRDVAKGRNVLNKTAVKALSKAIKTFETNLASLYSEYARIDTDETKTEYVARQLTEKKFNGKTLIESLTEILHGIGILVDPEVVKNVCLLKVGKGRTGSNAYNITKLIKSDVLRWLTDMDDGDGIPSSLTGNKAGRGYFPIITMLSNSVQEFVEASVYQDGKTYYSYTNPSKLGHIIRNLKDAISSYDPNSSDGTSKFEKYMRDNFGRYTGWFKDVEGNEWLCDWLKQFDENGTARQALQHKVELSYIGNKYRDLGSLGFQLSILHNYFGSKNDQTTNNSYRWFALPTMSNKPTNEFIRMIKYKNTDEIVDKVLMNTFKQEMNRIADVLYHYTHHNVATDQIDLTTKKLEKAGWSKEEIQGLRDRIDNHTLVPNDIIRLFTITSGAKFHFLWYLNNEIASNDDLAFRITQRLNVLLTTDSAEKEDMVDPSYEIDTDKAVRAAIVSNMETIVDSELEEMRRIGLFDKEIKKINGKEVEILKYQEEFGGNLGDYLSEDAEEDMENALKEFIWQDIAANINIIQITGGDLAYYGNAVNYQKRIAQIHSPGLHLMHDDEYDDGYLRSVHISDEAIRGEIIANTEKALRDYLERNKENMSDDAIREYETMITIIVSKLTETEATDGQSYSSITSIRKKLADQGEWDDAKEEAYNAIRRGHFNINHLGVMLQPSKPFVTSDMAKYSGSTTMELRKTPLQDKNSEYLIILAEALAKGSGIRSKLVAISEFMEDTAYDKVVIDKDGNKIRTGYNRKGIDTCHFASVNKVGKSGVIDISGFDRMFDEKLKKGEVSENDYNDLLTEYLHYHVRTKKSSRQSAQSQDDYDANERLVQEGKLKKEETLYNSQYVDTIPIEDYIIQQEVPAHLLDHEQLYGSQIRILGISDISDDEDLRIDVNGESLTKQQLVNEYKELHAQNIRESYEDLKKELGFDKLEDYIQEQRSSGVPEEDIVDTIAKLPIGNPIRETIYRNLAALLQKELSRDAKYGLDVRRACSLKIENGHVVDFNVPLMDPIQSKRIQMLINSIIKKTINKQKITGGPVVQTTAYDKNLHIRFKDKHGGLLLTEEEYIKRGFKEYVDYKDYVDNNQAGIAYFECYMPVPNAELERLMLNPDGSMMSYEELFDHEENGKTVKGKLPADIQKAMSEVIGYRIPTEDKYSMIPLKIMGFVPKAAGQVIMMPQEITYLTGSDFDIDKMYIMLKSFSINKDIAKKSKDGKDDISALITKFVKAGNSSFPGIQSAVKQIISNANHIIRGDEDYAWTTGIAKDENYEQVKKFVQWYRNTLLTTTFSEYEHYSKDEINELKKKGITLNRRELREGRNNRLLDLQWAVLTNEDTASKMLNPGNFNEQKKTGRIIRILKSKAVNPETEELWTWDELSKMEIEELDNLLENANPHNTTLPSSKIYFQRQNMQGSQMVGIFANHNVSHAFLTFQKIAIDLYKGGHNNTLRFDGYEIGNPDNLNGMDSASILDRQVGLNGQLISKTIASFLAASVDTAKDPTLSDMNISTFTGGVAMTLARLGFDTASIGLFLSQPIIMRLSDLYFKNKTDGYYDGETAISELASQIGLDKKDLSDTTGIRDTTLSKENFIDHLNDTDYEDGDTFQKRVLIAFNSLYKMSKDLGELTFCTKFNSVSNAVGPTIADTMSDLDRVTRLFVRQSEDDTVFYSPEDSEEYTKVTEVILNDPILNAFYESTISDGKGEDNADVVGASALIFKGFFPHYYEGFKNVRDYFQENYMGGKKMSSKLYNQLLDEYLYYLLTYDSRDDGGNSPTLPYSEDHKRQLVKSLVADFKEVLKIYQKIKNSRPNALLDQSLGGNCLRIRGKDEYIATDILTFNGSQMNADAQQKIKNAWSDLITMNNPNLTEEENEKMKKFGSDLFFYTLMRNGFGFSPKTLMHLASVVVRYNATYKDGFNNYITGLTNLRDVDTYLMGDPFAGLAQIKNFCSQFVRNHANNGQLIPKIDFESEIVWGESSDELVIRVPVKDRHKLYKVIQSNKNPYGFITIIKKDRATKKLSSQLYELSERNEDSEEIEIIYKKTNRLGLTNNFIEYDANSELKKSYFENIRGESQDDLDEETGQQEMGKDESDDIGGYSVNSNEKPAWSSIMNEIVLLEGPQKGKEYRRKLRAAYKDAEKGSYIVDGFMELLGKKSAEDKQQIMNEINKQYEEENKCNM